MLEDDLPVTLMRLGLATVLGLVLGFERERHGHDAGLRTHGLVARDGLPRGLVPAQVTKQGSHARRLLFATAGVIQNWRRFETWRLSTSAGRSCNRLRESTSGL